MINDHFFFSSLLFEKHCFSKWFFPWHAEHVLPWAGHCLGMCFRPQHLQFNILLSVCSSVRFRLGLETAPTVVLSLTAVAPISLKVQTCCCDNSHAWQICIAPSSKRSVSLSSRSLTFLSTMPLVTDHWVTQHSKALRFRSVKKLSNDSRNCWILKQKMYLSYVSFFLGEQSHETFPWQHQTLSPGTSYTSLTKCIVHLHSLGPCYCKQ